MWVGVNVIIGKYQFSLFLAGAGGHIKQLRGGTCGLFSVRTEEEESWWFFIIIIIIIIIFLKNDDLLILFFIW